MSLTERSYKVPTDARTHTRGKADRSEERKRGGRERVATVTKWLVAVRTLRQRESNHVCRLMGRARDRSTGASRDANRFSGVAPENRDGDVGRDGRQSRGRERERERQAVFVAIEKRITGLA